MPAALTDSDYRRADSSTRYHRSARRQSGRCRSRRIHQRCILMLFTAFPQRVCEAVQLLRVEQLPSIWNCPLVDRPKRVACAAATAGILRQNTTPNEIVDVAEGGILGRLDQLRPLGRRELAFETVE